LERESPFLLSKRENEVRVIRQLAALQALHAGFLSRILKSFVLVEITFFRSNFRENPPLQKNSAYIFLKSNFLLAKTSLQPNSPVDLSIPKDQEDCMHCQGRSLMPT
jgi:hypothetical protein